MLKLFLTRSWLFFLPFCLSGCLSTAFYVDTSTKEIPVSEFKMISQPKPVTVMFEFQTNGAHNDVATRLFKEQVVEQVRNSKLFIVDSSSSTKMAVVGITINNVVIDENAVSKGVATGLTFGLAGSTVSDGYICTVSYLPEGSQTPIIKTAKHAIHATIGNASAPKNGIKQPDANAATSVMIRDVLSNTLYALSHDENFK